MIAYHTYRLWKDYVVHILSTLKNQAIEESLNMQQMNLWLHLPWRKALDFEENGILKNNNHFMSGKVNIWTLGCVWVPNTKSNDIEGSGKIPHWRYRWLSPLLMVLALYCSCTRTFESSRQKSPCSSLPQGRATRCLCGEDLCCNDDVIFFTAKKMTSSLLHNPRHEDTTCSAPLIMQLFFLCAGRKEKSLHSHSARAS